MPPRTRSSSDYAAIRVEVAARASSQANVFTRVDLARWGIDPDICRTMVRRRHWSRLRYGIYADTDSITDADPHARHVLDTAAALASLDQPAFAFGLTAAHLHGLPLPNEHAHVVHLVRDLGIDHRALRERLIRRRGLPDIRVTGHALERLATTTLHDLPVVSRPLAALSSAASLPMDWAVAVMDSVCFGDALTLEALRGMVEDWPSLLGVGVVRRALPLVRIGAQSPLESVSRVRLVALGLPEPALQVPFFDDDGLVGYVDMWWPEFGVIGEADGAMKYDDGISAVIAEKRREDRLRALGHVVVRWSWSEIFRHPEAVAGRIHRASRVARTRRSRQAG